MFRAMQVYIWLVTVCSWLTLRDLEGRIFEVGSVFAEGKLLRILSSASDKISSTHPSIHSTN